MQIAILPDHLSFSEEYKVYKIGRVLRFLTDAFAFFGCVAVVLMMLHITIDVFLRWVGLPIHATVTIVPHYYMLPIVFLPLALAERNDAHITVELFVQVLQSRWQRILAVLSWLVSTGVFGILFYQTLIDAIEKMAIGTFIVEVDWKIPIWASYFFLPMGFGLVILVLLYRIVINLFSYKSGLGETKHAAFSGHQSDAK